MDDRTKEYVESCKDADALEEKARELAEAVGMSGPDEFGAAYVQREIVNNNTLDYQVLPSGGRADYAVIDEVDPRSTNGCSGSIPAGPIERLRSNGFIVAEVDVYVDGAVPLLVKEYEDRLPDDYIVVYVKYLGAEHPIIEYWENDAEVDDEDSDKPSRNV